MDENPYRTLPSVSELSAEISTGSTIQGAALTAFIQAFLQSQRDRIRGGDRPTRAGLNAELRSKLAENERPQLAPLINATGVVIHTNLGRAPVSPETAAAMTAAAAHFVALEIEPATNHRGGR